MSTAPPNLTHLTPPISAEDLRQHITYLASEQMGGRLTGTEGERRATAYVAAVFHAMGLAPAGDNSTFFQSFEFTAGVSLGGGNQLMAHQSTAPLFLNYAVDRDWHPLAFSKTGSFASAPVVFAGYGIVAPATDRFETYDALAGLDVANAWVLVLRYLAEEISVNLKSRGQLPLRRDLLFAAWSGEELGLLGSTHFTRTFGGTPDELASLAPQVGAYLNCHRLLPEGRASPQRFHRCARRLSHAA